MPGKHGIHATGNAEACKKTPYLPPVKHINVRLAKRLAPMHESATAQPSAPARQSTDIHGNIKKHIRVRAEFVHSSSDSHFNVRCLYTLLAVALPQCQPYFRCPCHKTTSQLQYMNLCATNSQTIASQVRSSAQKNAAEPYVKHTHVPNVYKLYTCV